MESQYIKGASTYEGYNQYKKRWIQLGRKKNNSTCTVGTKLCGTTHSTDKLTNMRGLGAKDAYVGLFEILMLECNEKVIGIMKFLYEIEIKIMVEFVYVFI